MFIGFFPYDLVLTAAHCLERIDPDQPLLLVAGKNIFGDSVGTEQVPQSQRRICREFRDIIAGIL